MFAKSLISLALVAATAVSVNAQAGLDQCIINCSVSAASEAGCSSFADIPCVCTSWAFQQAARKCITANCPASDLDAALSLQQLECTAYPSPTGPSKTPSGPTKTPSAPSKPTDKPTEPAEPSKPTHTTEHTSATHSSATEHTTAHTTPTGAPSHTSSATGTAATHTSSSASAPAASSTAKTCPKKLSPEVLENVSKALASISSALSSISAVLKTVNEAK